MSLSYKPTVVSFLDVLGTRERIDFASKYNVHRIFHESMRDFAKRDRQDLSYARKMFNFSDCAYLLHELKSEARNDENSEDALINVALHNTMLVTLRLLYEGYLVRGGIVFGDAYHDDLSLFGPAVEEAYLIESKQAVVPRIMLSGTLGARAKALTDRNHEEFFSDENPQWSYIPRPSYIPEMVSCQNNSYFLNPFYQFEMGQAVQIGNEHVTHECFKNAILEKLDEQTPAHPWEDPTRAKLEWMKDLVRGSHRSVPDGHDGLTTFSLPTDK
ncbi:MAG TPA: hypothetical protein VGN46_09375 [Luteibacter sp.]|jgi:hypothetical protein|uniref:hypothetical protein n=1 Tax=Luteibacter sp. TaxID=1886636 RepID=UPI002F41C9C0